MIEYDTCRKCGHNAFTKAYNELTDRIDWTCLGCGFREGRLTLEEQERIRRTSQQLHAIDRQDDLMTIIDFCDAMAHGQPYEVIDASREMIQKAHALAHKITDDSERPVVLRRLEQFFTATGDDKAKYLGPAWPDVRRRMLGLIARVQE